MVQIIEETTIDASQEAIFDFLTHMDTLYKVWHPKDHVFCSIIKGNFNQVGAVFHFLEWLGWFPLYGIAKVTHVEKNQYIEYQAAFPLSLLRLASGYFKIEKINLHQSKLIAQVQYGYNAKWIDKVISVFVSKTALEQHMQEEGKNLKQYLRGKNTLSNIAD